MGSPITVALNAAADGHPNVERSSSISRKQGVGLNKALLFISILAEKLPIALQQRARVIGLSLAVVSRLLLLFSLSWIIRLTEPIFSVRNFNVTGRDVILILGGFFLIGKATHEIHDQLEGEEGHASARVKATFYLFRLLVAGIPVGHGLLVGFRNHRGWYGRPH